LSKDGFEVVKVDCSVASISLFRIDVPSSSESVWFGAKMTRAEPDNKIELGKVLRLPCLLLDQHLGSRKILKAFMICNNINWIGWTLQVVSLNFESFEDGKQFLVMCVVVQLHYSESMGVKSHQMNFIFFVTNRKDCSESIVQSISFHDELSIKNLMSKDGSRDECLLERIESITTGRVELPKGVLPGKVCQWNDNV